MDKTVIEIRPIEDSANGKTNAYSHCCMSVGHFRNYAVCLHLIKERENGRLSTMYSDCSVSIGKKNCPALSMRKAEVAAGHAIYFQERVKNLGSAFMDIADTVMNKITKVIAPKEAKSPVTNKSIQPDMGGYADAINNSLKKTEVEPPKPIKAVEGESLMELAKRMMLAKA